MFLEKNLIHLTTLVKWLGFGIFLFLVFFAGFKKIRDKKLLAGITNKTRGTPSERELVIRLLKLGIPQQAIFHDLYLKNYNGKYSQIDLVVAAKVGIIVFEVKSLSGWIFGDGRYTQWTQVLAYGRQKYRFYNPIMQNKKHIDDLRKQLTQFENIPFYSVVVFYGDCELKEISFVPEGTFLVKPGRVSEVMRIILEKNELVPYTDKFEIVRILKEAVQNGGKKEIQNRHIENIKDMLGKHRIFD